MSHEMNCVKCASCGGIAAWGPTCLSCQREALGKEYKNTIKALMEACNELMTEFVSRKRAADWEIINDAMVAGAKAVKA